MADGVRNPAVTADNGRAAALLVGLDDQQRHAVTTPSQPLIIKAGAGSGKTRVLTRRVAYRALQQDLEPRHALCVTFTREAASELRGRLSRLGLRDLPAAGTFHSIALGLLRTRWHDLRQQEPTLLTDRSTMLRRVAGRRGDPALLARVAIEIDWARARSIRPDRYQQALAKRRRRPAVDPDLVASVFAEYEAAKRSAKVVDFDDLLERCAEAFRTDDGFAQAQRWRFRHLFVDEFQDVNPLQFKLLQAWLGPNRDLCAVGDANQAIYGWNGADPTLFNRLTELLDGGEVVELSTNHRSSPAVVAVSGSALAPGDAPKASIERPPGTPPRVHACTDADHELAVVAAQLRRWRDSGLHWRMQAVLVRTNAQVTELVNGLSSYGIPAARAGGSQQALLRGIPRIPAQPSAQLRWTDLLDQLEDPVLQELASEYAALDTAPSPEGFRHWAATATADEGLAVDAVRVGTFHRAKGREWRAVIVAGVEDGFVPASTVRTEEERRLFYVALSRASEQLLCTWSARRVVRGTLEQRRPSPFLAAVQLACDAAHQADAPQPMPAGLAAAAGLHLTSAAAPVEAAALTLADMYERRITARHRLLQRWRAAAAKAAAVSPNAVLSDATVKELATDPPLDIEDLARRNGVGPIRAGRIGPGLLRALQAER